MPVVRFLAHVRRAERPPAIDDRDVVALELRVPQMVGQHAQEVNERVRLASQSGLPSHARVTADRSQC